MNTIRPVFVAITVLTVSVSARLSSQGTARPAQSEPTPVAEAPYVDLAPGLVFPLLPVKVNGRPADVFLDLGSNGSLLSKDFGSSPAELTIGNTVVPGFGFNPIDEACAGASLKVHVPCLLGTIGLSSRFDFVFDGPARRARLYASREGKVSDSSGRGSGQRPPWLPPGLTPEDCVPLCSEYNACEFVFFNLMVNGKSIRGEFDSGAYETRMNWAAAESLGVKRTSPHVHLREKAAQYLGARDSVWVVDSGITIMVGRQRLTDLPVFVLRDVRNLEGNDFPFINLGLQAFGDRRFMISYSTKQVCVGPKV